MGAALSFDPRTELFEHCCSTGMVQRDGQLVLCPRCNGSTRVRRHMFSAASGIDYDPEAEARIERLLAAQRSPNAPQPPPKPGVAVHTVDLVVADLWERKGVGIAKYGVAHQWDDGRDHLVDAYQESLDLTVYLRAELEKRRRMVALARLLRDDANSEPLRELLELIDGGAA